MGDKAMAQQIVDKASLQAWLAAQPVGDKAMAQQIVDKASLQAWLAGQPVGVARIIAHRIAARVLPMLAGGSHAGGSDTLLTALVFRATVALRMFCVEPGAARKAAVRASSDVVYAVSAFSAADVVADAAIVATVSAAAAADAVSADFFAADASKDIWVQIEKDARHWEKHQDTDALLYRPLWPDQPPAWANQAWQDLQTTLIGDDPNWQFWLDFYRTILTGQRYSAAYIDLLDGIAQKDDAFWDRAPKTINADIATDYQNYKDTQAQANPAPSPAATQKQQLAAHIRLLLADPAQTEQQANFLAQQIETAVEQTKRDINDHQGLEIYENLAAQIKQLAKSVSDKDTEIATLKAKNQALRDTLAKIEEQIKNSDSPSIKESLKQCLCNFLEESGKSAGKTVGTMIPLFALYSMIGDAPAIFALLEIVKGKGK